jgi:pyruvate/2-oxoglutarate dehydrogenase complex dihydrolipoamide dehydrogenase (E3) component
MAGRALSASPVPPAVPRALAARDTRGLIKLIADKANDRLLGGQIMAPEGADSIQTLVLAIKQRRRLIVLLILIKHITYLSFF